MFIGGIMPLCVPIKDLRNTAAFDEMVSNSPSPVIVTKNGYDPNTAASFLNEWENALERLREESVIHRLSRFDILARLGYYTILIKGYIALYFIEDGDVIIAHLFHQSQDYANIVLNGI